MHIDWWTLALQTVNVLILVWILGRFLFRPVMAIIDKRQQVANGLLADAEQARQRADEALNDAERTRAEIADRRQVLLDQARAEARIEKTHLVEQASLELSKMRQKAAIDLQHDRADVEEALIDRARELSLDIARRLLDRLSTEAALPSFLDGLCERARSLSPEAREGLVRDGRAGTDCVVATAWELSAEQRQQVEDKLAKAIGRDLPLSFCHDPTLVAGFELHGATTIVRNSWRSDLGRIREELLRVRQT
jgi:F-type H+-transporting ATPase subunit b